MVYLLNIRKTAVAGIASLVATQLDCFTPPQRMLWSGRTINRIPGTKNTNDVQGTRPSCHNKQSFISSKCATTRYSSSSNNNNDAAFTAFADSLNGDDELNNRRNIASTNLNEAASTTTSSGSTYRPQYRNTNRYYDSDDDDIYSWQESLEMLLDPTTSLARRQILFSDLMGANEEIRNAVMTALRERKVDPILTPTGKKLQDGTRAVARQLTMDIIPGFANAVLSENNRRRFTEELPLLVPKIGERVLNAFSAQARKQLEQLQGDLQNPSRIPDRISKQTAGFAAEARNVFSDMPQGLDEPAYRIVTKGIGYEIREYEGYTAAATSMSKVGEVFSEDDLASEGAAFNAIAAYLFGANEDEKSMSMTTPVTTTSVGEMRFYLRMSSDMRNFPKPLAIEDRLNEKGAVKLIDVPPARLAVSRFTGFVTSGEVARQKDALLCSLAIDGVDLDVPHGSVVPYFVFQYNPPYTLPIMRRNEIAIPVLAPGEELKMNTEWEAGQSAANENYTDENNDAPSDVE